MRGAGRGSSWRGKTLALWVLASWGAGAAPVCVTVKDPQGQMVAGAQVRLEPVAAAAVLRGETGAEGRTCVEAGPGKYVVRIESEAFAGAAGLVTVEAGGAAQEQEYTLKLAAVASQVQVTGSRLPENLLEAPLPVTQLDRRRLQALGARGLNDALQEQPEVVTFAGGAHANGGSTNVQGSTSRNVEILVDGQPLAGRVSGYLDLNQIDSSMVEAVEIKAGASAMTYGLQGQGGAINLITRRASSGAQAAVESGYGSFNTMLERAEGGFAARGWAVLVAGATQRNLGYDLDATTAAKTQAANRTDNLLASLYAPGWKRVNAGLTALYTGQSYWGFDTNATLGLYDFERPKKRVVLLPRATVALDEHNVIGARARHLFYRTAEELYYRPGQTFAHTATTQTADGGEAEWTHLRANGLRLFSGVSFLRQDIVGSKLGTADGNAQRDSWSQLSSVEYTWRGRLKLQGGYRADHDSAFGNRVSPQVSVAYHVAPGWSASASVARGFRAPDFSELYLNNTHAGGRVRVLGNAALEPESSWSTSAGLLYTKGERLRVEGRVFENRLAEMILTRLMGREGIASIYRYMNTGAARVRGGQVTASTMAGRSLRLSGSYQYLHTRDATAGTPLEYSPKNRGTVSATWFGRRAGLLASVYGNMTGRTFYAVSGTAWDYMQSFEQFGANVQKELGRHLALRMTLRNLSDNVDPAYRVTAPFSVEASVRIKIGRGE